MKLKRPDHERAAQSSHAAAQARRAAHFRGDCRGRFLHDGRQCRLPHAVCGLHADQGLEDILRKQRVFARCALGFADLRRRGVARLCAALARSVNREAVSKFIVPDIVGVVRLGSPDDYGERILPYVLKRFAQTHPSIAVDVTIDQSNNLRRRVDGRTLDITLITNSFKASMAGAEVLLTDQSCDRRCGSGCAYPRSAAGVALGRGLRMARRCSGCAPGTQGATTGLPI